MRSSNSAQRLEIVKSVNLQQIDNISYSHMWNTLTNGGAGTSEKYWQQKCCGHHCVAPYEEQKENREEVVHAKESETQCRCNADDQKRCDEIDQVIKYVLHQPVHGCF